MRLNQYKKECKCYTKIRLWKISSSKRGFDGNVKNRGQRFVTKMSQTKELTINPTVTVKKKDSNKHTNKETSKLYGEQLLARANC